MKKFLAILFSVLLVLGLFAGCGKDDPAGAGNGGANGSSNSEPGSNGAGSGNEDSAGNNEFGAVVVNANAAIEVIYDTNGLVVKVNGLNENGNGILGEYQDYLGKTCADVVCDVITHSVRSQFLTEEVNYVMIKQTHGSRVPTDSFLSGVEKDAEAAIAEAGSMAKLVVLTLEDLYSEGYNEGYINPEAARKLMQAYVASEKTDYLCVGSDEPIDGKYGYLFGYENIPEEKLIVDAITGDVYPGELEGVDYGDENLEDEDLPTDPDEEIMGDENDPQVTEPSGDPEDVVSEPTDTEVTE